jgi:hypothetical protein
MATKRWGPPNYELPEIAVAFEEFGLRGYVANEFHLGSYRGNDNPVTEDEARRVSELDRAVEFAETIHDEHEISSTYYLGISASSTRTSSLHTVITSRGRMDWDTRMGATPTSSPSGE